ncbi:MAG: hypothetical protein AB7U81_02340 [Thiohalomonadaceae bacterium]
MDDRRLRLRVAAKLLAWIAIIAVLVVLFRSLSPSPDALGARPRAQPRDLPAPPP